jgi:hypothetical protein
MIEDLMQIDIKNLDAHHDKIMQEMIDYNVGLEFKLTLYNEYEEIDGVYYDDFIENEQETLYTMLGTTSAVLYIYNKHEKFELSSELHKEMEHSFCLIMDKIFKDTDNTIRFRQLIDSMFETFKKILQ